MALPVAPAPKPNDVAVLGWAGLTVRVAWTLLACGVKVRPDALRDARNHVLHVLDPTLSLPHAEDLAMRWVEAFVVRARGERPFDPWPSDWEMGLSPRWRRSVEHTLDSVGAAVFRKHYGDGRSLASLEQSLALELVDLEAVRSGLRESVRRTAIGDGLPLDDWTGERVDRLLRRIAAYAPTPCPSPLDISEGCHRDHVVGCTRCDRTLRLLKSGNLTIDDLFPPTLGARPSGRVRVLVLNLHPDARKAQQALWRELPQPVLPVGDDLLLLDARQLAAIAPVLGMALEIGVPPREHLRGAIVEGPGSFTPRGLIGPLAEAGIREVGLRPWGSVDGLGPLPEALPEPPSAHSWWAVTAVLAVLAVVAAVVAGWPTADSGGPLRASFVNGRGGVWVTFDAPEAALVTVLAERDGAVFPVVVSASAADKARFATGDGRYRFHVAADAVLVAAHDQQARVNWPPLDAVQGPLEVVVGQLQGGPVFAGGPAAFPSNVWTRLYRR